jgi:amino acid transporter
LTVLDGTVIGVASTAPAYSLTATVGLLIGSIGLFGPSAMVLAFLPMLGVAVGFYWLNRRIPNCGTSYAWIAKALHPALGFFTGWVIVAADVIVMISLAGVAAASTLTLFGQDTTNKASILIIGIAWIVLLTWLVVRGIRLSAKTQWVLLGLEYVIVVAFCIWAIVKVYASHPPGSHVLSLNWVLPWQAPGGKNAVLTAVLAAVFIYWVGTPRPTATRRPRTPPEAPAWRLSIRPSRFWPSTFLPLLRSRPTLRQTPPVVRIRATC